MFLTCFRPFQGALFDVAFLQARSPAHRLWRRRRDVAGQRRLRIERVLLTHGHIDHIAGLPPLIWSRAGGMGDNEKPLAIYHPKGDATWPTCRIPDKTKARLPF
jgi:ribonuclease BN (tRNA processing enzyme)